MRSVESVTPSTELAHDFNLLNSLGVRLVLVYGVRPQVEEGLRGVMNRFAM